VYCCNINICESDIVTEIWQFVTNYNNKYDFLLRQNIMPDRAIVPSSLTIRKASDVKAATTFLCEKEEDHYRGIQHCQV
jgi:hypothetical protein